MTSRPRTVARCLEDLIGGTPLVQVTPDGIPDGVEVLAKLELMNPLSSIKDRTSLFMMQAAEEMGLLRPGTSTVVEASSGNTGISLAALSAARGYRCIIVMPDSATEERVRIVRALGAEVVHTPSQAGYPGAIEKAEHLHRQIPGSWFPRQHENHHNVRAHFETTGPEIWAACEGQIDVFVCGVGTGGTLTGVARYLKSHDPSIHVVAVEPEGSPVLSGGAGGPHRIPGLNGGFVAATTDVSCIDEVITISDEAAADSARRLARSSGLLVGLSSGAAAQACLEVARRVAPSRTTIVTIFPDSGERYLTVWPDDKTRGDR